MSEELDKAIATMIETLYDAVGTTATSITVDIQPNGELPYRITLPEEILPAVGLARVEPVSDTAPAE